MRKAKTDDFGQLSTAEKIHYLQDLWDQIASDPEGVPITEAQREELDRRLIAHQQAPREGARWEEVKKRVRSSR